MPTYILDLTCDALLSLCKNTEALDQTYAGGSISLLFNPFLSKFDLISESEMVTWDALLINLSFE